MPDRRRARAPLKRGCIVARASAAARSCNGAKLRPAARSAKSAALTGVAASADLARQLPADARPPRFGAAHEPPAEQCPPTRSSPEGVRPAPRPSSGQPAASAAPASSARTRAASARTSGIARSSGNCGVLRTRSAPKPPGFRASRPLFAACVRRATRPNCESIDFEHAGDQALRGNRFETQLAPAHRRSSRSSQRADAVPAAATDPDDLPVRLVPRRFRECGRGRAAPPLRSSARPRALADRDDPQPGALFCCCMPAIRQTTPNSA
jgi:hypothetical protein